MMNDVEIIKSLIDQGLAFVICAIFLTSIACLIRIALSWLKSKVTTSDNEVIRKTETETSNKAFVILQKALINANLKRLNFMRFYYSEAVPPQLSFVCGKAELLGKGVPSLGGHLCHIAQASFPVFFALLRRDGQVLLDSSNKDPNLIDSVYVLHDAEKSKVLCIVVYDISRRALGYLFAQKDIWSEDDKKYIVDAATYLGVLLSGVEGVL